jgi:hypothetical protein
MPQIPDDVPGVTALKGAVLRAMEELKAGRAKAPSGGQR